MREWKANLPDEADLQELAELVRIAVSNGLGDNPSGTSCRIRDWKPITDWACKWTVAEPSPK
jgi:hypothetical protein